MSQDSTSTASEPSATSSPLKKLTQTTCSVYDQRSGLLTQLTEDDGQTTYLDYYQVPTKAKTDRSDQLPLLTTLLKDFKLQGPTGTKLLDAMALSCPNIPDSTLPPLMAQCEYQQFPDESKRSVMLLTLYGYAQGSKNASGVLIPDTVLKLEGVAVDTTVSPWTVEMAEGREGLVVDLLQLINTRSADEIKTVTTSTRWYKNNATRQERTLTQTTKVDTTNGTLLTKSTAPLQLGELTLTAILAQQLRSARSGRVLLETQQDELGRPKVMLSPRYDVRDRSLGSRCYAWDEADFIKGSRDDNALTAEHLEWIDTGDGTWVRVQGPDGRCGRTLLDGLQRPVRRELQRIAGDNHDDANYICLEEIAYDTNGGIAHRCTYDYLPGGLCLRNEGVALSENQRDWFWQAQERISAQVSQGGEALTTKTMTGTLVQGPLRRLTLRQENLRDGKVTRTCLNERWNATTKALEETGLSWVQRFDAQGQLTQVVEQHQVNGQSIKRNWTCDHDELGRRVKIVTPDESVLEWSYEGFGTTPVKITLTAKGKGGQVLGTAVNQGEEMIARTVGTAESPLKHSLDGKRVRRPDDTRIWNELSDDGNTLSWYTDFAESGVKVPKRLVASFTYNEVTQGLYSERPEQALSAQARIHCESTAPQLLGRYLSTRYVRGMRQLQHSQRSLRSGGGVGRHASGVTHRAWQDGQQRRNRIRRGGLEYRYLYGAQGEIEQLVLQELRSGRTLSLRMTYDSFGREIQRTYRLDGVLMSRYQQSWSAIGQLLEKTWYRNGEDQPTRTETFTYCKFRNELETWSVVAADGFAIEDANGKALKAQAYTYDELGNVLSCITTFDDDACETRTYAYSDATQPTRRTSTTLVVPGSKGGNAVELDTDVNGSLVSNAQGQSLTYTYDGQLQSIKDGDQLITSYEYDELGRLATQWNESLKQRHVFEYDQDRLCGEQWLSAEGVMLKHRVLDEEAGLAVYHTDQGEEGDTTRLYFVLADPQGSGGEEYVIDGTGQWQSQSIGFTPWGEAPLRRLTAMNSGLSYNAQRVDPVTGHYHLGNGYRVYDPQHQAFYQSDSLSPFGEGGLNDRAYCAGRDPVNWHDPSGHIMINRREQSESLASLDEMIRDTTPPHHEPTPWWEYLVLGYLFILAVAAAVVTAGAAGALILAVAMAATALSAAAMATRHSNPVLSNKLDLASVIVGFADTILTGGAKAAAKIGKWGMQAARSGRSLRNYVKVASLKLLSKLSGGVKLQATIMPQRAVSPVGASSHLNRSMITWGGAIDSPFSVYYSSNPDCTAKIWVAHDLYNVKPALQHNILEVQKAKSSLAGIVTDAESILPSTINTGSGALTDFNAAVKRAKDAQVDIQAIGNEMASLSVSLQQCENALQTQLLDLAPWDKKYDDWTALLDSFRKQNTGEPLKRQQLLAFFKKQNLKPNGYDALKSRSVLSPKSENAFVIKECTLLIDKEHGARIALKKSLSLAQKLEQDKVGPLLQRLKASKGEIASVLKELPEKMLLYANSISDATLSASALTAQGRVLMASSNTAFSFRHPLKRLKLMFHGARPQHINGPVPTSQAVVQIPAYPGAPNKSYWGADKMYSELSALTDRNGRQLIDFKSVDVIQLNMCHGAAGGQHSFAQEMSVLAGSPVKGYVEPLTTLYSVDTLDDTVQHTFKGVNSGMTPGAPGWTEMKEVVYFVTDNFRDTLYLRSAKLKANPQLHSVAYDPQWFFPKNRAKPQSHQDLKQWMRLL
ncbi:RHS repeat domain-containing protein [Pseudomonas oryziphila]|uniref:Teneurin-like YD-shell domain-containing protein n=1 Tax=Pseudomonas entomophila TaxID=312306 RepID=A0A3S8UJ76_9PSED|nr:RHS repeat-associated core domain-containing protein [Pseudomonas oryziphila]AZL68425.1 hypothetical protein EJA05_12125 [Pseudomonas oryziphila]